MKFAVIPPTNALQRYASDQDLHLCLAHLILNDLDYLKFYRERVKLGDFVILDNSAYELGSSMSAEHMLKAAKLLNPSEIVLPDKLRDSDATIKIATEFFKAVDKELSPETRIMIVPQGNDADEWIKNMKKLLKEIPADTVGIPVLASGWPNGRFPLIEAVPDKVDIHMLGYSGSNLWEAYEAEQLYPGRIRSIDSCKPIVYAYHNTMLTPTIPEGHTPKYAGRPKCYFELEFARGSQTDLYAKSNIVMYRSLCGGNV